MGWCTVARQVACRAAAGLWLCQRALAGEPEVLSPLKNAEWVTAPLMTGQDGLLYGTSSGGRLIEASDGWFYGTTVNGGRWGHGTVFNMRRNGTLFRFTTGGQWTTLHAFGPPDPVGEDTRCALLERADGEFIGATSAGGPKGRGSIFRLQLSPP